MSGSKSTRTTQEIRKDAKPLISYPLGDGLEIWKVELGLLQEQSVNARAMSQTTFNQLSQNIKNRGGLESLPLCAVTEKGIEIISGHHRTRAARKAELKEIWALVDVSGLSMDQIKAKQLAHNSLQGIDNDDIVKQIFDSITDVDAKIEAALKFDTKDLDFKVPLDTKGLDIELETKTAIVVFLPSQMAIFKKAIEELKAVSPDDVFLATKEEYDKLIEAMDSASLAFNITSTPTLLAKMAEIVMEHIANGDNGKES